MLNILSGIRQNITLGVAGQAVALSNCVGRKVGEVIVSVCLVSQLLIMFVMNL